MNSSDNNDPRNNPNNWVWGVFYVNKDDSRVLVPKRIAALGWTLNFGNKRTGLFLLGIAFVIALSLRVAEIFSK